MLQLLSLSLSPPKFNRTIFKVWFERSTKRIFALQSDWMTRYFFKLGKQAQASKMSNFSVILIKFFHLCWITDTSLIVKCLTFNCCEKIIILLLALFRPLNLLRNRFEINLKSCFSFNELLPAENNWIFPFCLNNQPVKSIVIQVKEILARLLEIIIVVPS